MFKFQKIRKNKRESKMRGYECILWNSEEEASLKCLVWADWMHKKVWDAKNMEMAKGVGLASWKGIGIERV
jgi:hypothetical protein